MKKITYIIPKTELDKNKTLKIYAVKGYEVFDYYEDISMPNMRDFAYFKKRVTLIHRYKKGQLESTNQFVQENIMSLEEVLEVAKQIEQFAKSEKYLKKAKNILEKPKAKGRKAKR